MFALRLQKIKQMPYRTPLLPPRPRVSEQPYDRNKVPAPQHPTTVRNIEARCEEKGWPCVCVCVEFHYGNNNKTITQNVCHITAASKTVQAASCTEAKGHSKRPKRSKSVPFCASLRKGGKEAHSRRATNKQKKKTERYIFTKPLPTRPGRGVKMMLNFLLLPLL